MSQPRQDERAAARAGGDSEEEVVLAVIDQERRLLEVAPSLAALGGARATELRGRRIGELEPTIAALMEPALRHVFATGEAIRVVEGSVYGLAGGCVGFYPVRSRGGAVVAVDMAAPAALLSRALGQTLGGARPLPYEVPHTEEQAPSPGEAPARASHTSLTKALEAGQAGTFEWDMRRKLNCWSPQLESLYGLPPGAFEGTYEAWVSRVEPEDIRAFEQGLAEALRERRAEYAYEFRAVLPGGERRWLAGRARFDYDAAGEPIRMLGVNFDIHERKMGEEANRQASATALARAEEATRERDLLISIAAHDLRTPLTVILGQARRLQRASEATIPDERTRRTLGTLADQSARLNKMIEALLDLSRIQEGRLTISPAPHDLVEVLGRVVAEVQSTVSDHHLTLEAPAEPVVINAELPRLEQVFFNLLGNAVKYSPGGGAITIQAEVAEARVQVRIRDQGIGIPSEALPHLFTRFYRAPNAAAQATSSMGVGLYVVRELVLAHGGAIAVESIEGAGSTFSVELPLAKVTAAGSHRH